MLIAWQLSEVGPRRSSYSAGVALEFELCHDDQAVNDPQAAVLSCAFTPRIILSEIKQRDLLNRRIMGYAPGWSALTLGLVRCAKLSGLMLEAQEVWMPLVASQPGPTSCSLLRSGSSQKAGRPDGVGLAWIITSCRPPIGLAIILRMAVPVRQTPAIASP